jgi:UMF1 family MFS transporter
MRGAREASPEREPWLERVGLHRPELRAWALYDWANSAFFTTVVTALFPLYYGSVAADGREDVLESYGQLTAWSMLAIAVLGPFLGALADTAAKRKPFLLGFMVLGVLATAAMWCIERGDWRLASALFVLGNVGVAGSFVFYDALLPAVARPGELDRVSTSAYALGYLGGGLLLTLNVAWILRPEWFGMLPGSTLPVRLSFVSVAVWWALFALPLFLRVREPPRALGAGEEREASSWRAALARLVRTAREFRRYRHAFLLMLAMLIYNDGIVTIIRMATLYGAELGLEGADLLPAILLVQFLGIPCALGFGVLAGRIGPKRAVLLGLAGYVGITALAWRMSTVLEFYLLAAGVALVMGGCQALTRSMFASMVPVRRAGEFFGLFGVLERFSSVLGPLAFSSAIAWSGSTRAGVVPLFAFFALGALLLARVDLDAGRRAAQDQ